MRFTGALLVLVFCVGALAQSTAQLAPQPSAELKSVTVPLSLDHNRVIIDVDLRLPDGSTKRVHAWVDNGNPDLYLSRRAATLMGLAVTCDEKSCTAPPPEEISIGGMKIPLNPATKVTIPLRPVAAAAVLVPGMSAEINLPATVLRSYDVLIDFPDRKFTIAQPGTLRFQGVKTKAIVNPRNGLVQIPSQIESKKYNLALDLGASIGFLSGELFEKLSASHSDWPRMTGAIGAANLRGENDEIQEKLMRVERLQYGPLFLIDVAVADLPVDRMTLFEMRAGIPTGGLLGSEALRNYRVGIDYAHSTVYFDIGRTFNFPDFDVIGLILRPEDDGRFTILGVADYDGKPSVPEGNNGVQAGVQAGDSLIAVDGIPVAGCTMGQVWSMLGGSPGMERRLTVDRAGRQFTVAAKVQHFLGDAPEENQTKKESDRKK
jgi:hypothetical protein